MVLKNVKIVLSRVSQSGNVGSVCRAMKNMGLSELRLATPASLAEEEVVTRAVNALDIWKNVQIFENLADAVADCTIVVGTTRRRGHKRKNISMPPKELAAWLAERPGQTAIVFGNERTGLEEDELNLCNIASHIPTSEAQPSLNLSHAVIIYAYELYAAFGAATAFQGVPQVKGEWHPMNQADISALVANITDSLAKAGFYKKYGRAEQTRFLQDMIARAGLGEKEGRYFRDLLIKAEILKKTSR